MNTENLMMAERREDETFLDQLGARDPGLVMVQEFHKAFGCHIAPRPTMPDLDPVDQQIMLGYAERLDAIAAELKMAAGHFNRSGRTALGLVTIRLQLHLEEACAEFARACAEGDLSKVLDSLADSRYVVNGSFLTFGLQEGAHAADCEVHRSNMSKLGADGRPVVSEAGRVVKGPHYLAADFGSIVEALSVE